MKRLLLSGAAVPALMALAAGSALAAEGEGTSLGLGIGRVTPTVESTDLGHTTWFTANLRLKVSRYFALEPEVGYWKRKETEAGIEVTFEDLNFGGSALIVIPTQRLELWGGGGGGGHRLKGSASGLDLGGSTTETRFGWHVVGGIDLKLSDRAALFGAGRYDKVKGDKSKNEKDLDEKKFFGGLRLLL